MGLHINHSYQLECGTR